MALKTPLWQAPSALASQQFLTRVAEELEKAGNTWEAADRISHENGISAGTLIGFAERRNPELFIEPN